MKQMRRATFIGRREFIRTGALAGLGLATLGAAPASGSIPPRVRRYASLGRTGA